ncbi:MAG: glycosyltransferase [Clostridiales bacterium]|nr:glycosyltransferase [Clostridiales bacterium]
MKKILILTASAGGGHNSAAKALKEAFDIEDCECAIVDSLKFVSPMLDRIVSRGYEKSAKYIPQTYGSFYKLSAGMMKKNNFDTLLKQVMGKKILNLVLSKKPDAIIGTHPFPTMALMKYKEVGRIDVPVISVLTDYTAHPAYVQNNVDAYIVGDTDVAYLLREFGVSMDKVYPFGIPVSRNFIQRSNVELVKEEFQLEDKFTVILMGGSFGAGNMRDCLLDLISSDYDFQIIVITGHDYSLKEKLNKLVSNINSNKPIRILGFTKEMPELLTIGDVLVTKPGGLTTTEAMLKGIPMVIPYYIPGQEEENIDYLLNNGLAIKTSTNYSLPLCIEMLMDNPERKQEIIERMEKKRKPDCADKTAKLVLSLIDKNENSSKMS